MNFEDQWLKACMQSNMFYGFLNYEYSKTCLKRPTKKKTKNCGFQDWLSLNAGQKYCRMLQETFIKLPFIFNVFDLSFFEWPLKTGFTVYGCSDYNSKISISIYLWPKRLSTGMFKAMMLNCSYLSHDVTSGSDKMPCNKIDKPLVVYR